MGWVFRATLISAVLSMTASAKALPVTLIWLAPEGCPQHAEVWARLSDRLGREPTTPDGTSFAARGEVVKADSGWTVSLQTLTASGAGTRSFTHASCAEVTRMAVLALSLAIDPALEPPPEVTARSLWLGAGATAAVGVLPLPSAGLTVTAGLDLAPASFHLSVLTSFTQRIPRGDGEAFNAGVPIGGSVAACVGYFDERLSLTGCASFTTALVSGEPEGIQRPRTGLAALVLLGPRVRARVLVHPRVALQTSVDGSFALSRPAFVFADGAVAYEVPLFSVSGALTVEFRIW